MTRDPSFSYVYYLFARPVATLFFCGYSRFAPGTVGSAVTLFPIAILLFFSKPCYDIFFSNAAFLPFVFFLYLAGTFASSLYVRQAQQHDPKEIVIDETLGQLISVYIPFHALSSVQFASVDFNAFILLTSFVLFRTFDILKPWPVSFFDKKMHNAHGIMLDDVAAGMCAGVISFLLVKVM
ncbi:MAG: phosphatidylglycerophosphatase A [Rickettsiales bacterium]